MKFEWYVSNRYLLAKKQTGTSLISKVSIFGLIFAIAALVVILSVVNGFQRELRDRVLDAIAHGYISSYDKFIDYQKIQKIIKTLPNIINATPYIENYALISYHNKTDGVVVKGIIAKQYKNISTIFKDISGTNILAKNNIIIGSGLAQQMLLSIGDKITLITSQTNTNILGTQARFKRFIISGIFNANTNEYDNNLVFIDLTQAQKLYKMPNDINGILLKTNNVLKANEIISSTVSKIDGNKYYGISWQMQKRNLIIALNLEKQMMSLVLFLIIAIAVFNVVSLMIMVVKDKKTDIAILRTMGLMPSQVIKIFFYQAIKIGVLGITIGIIVGTIFAYNIESIINFIEYIFNFKIFPTSVFYINNFPVDIQIIDIINIIVISFVLVILSAIYPALFATKINIAQTLKEL